MSRILDLIQKTLWHCTTCRRLEYADEQPLCQNCPGIRMYSVPRDPTEEFEAIGQHFYRDTGYVRPGKDCRKHDIAERQEAFDKWNKGGDMKFTEDEIIAQRAANILHDAEVKIDHLNELADSVTELAQDGKRFAFLKGCTNGGHFNEERQELVWTFHIPAKRMHGNITAALDHARFADEKA